MRYFLSFIIILVFSMVNLYGQAKPVMAKDSPVGGDLTGEVVKKFCDQVTKELDNTQKDFKKQSYQNYVLLSHQLNKWLHYQFLELDSDINRSWFNKVQEFLVFFHNTKKTYDRSLDTANSKAKILNKNRFEAGVANFKKFMELKPPKPPPQRLEVLKRRKEEYLKAKRAEERRKGNAGKKRLFDD